MDEGTGNHGTSLGAIRNCGVGSIHCVSCRSVPFNPLFVQIQVKTKKKAEIQALSSFGFQYITEEYLPRKLKEGDWI